MSNRQICTRRIGAADFQETAPGCTGNCDQGRRCTCAPAGRAWVAQGWRNAAEQRAHSRPDAGRGRAGRQADRVLVWLLVATAIGFTAYDLAIKLSEGGL